MRKYRKPLLEGENGDAFVIALAIGLGLFLLALKVFGEVFQ